MLRSLLAVIAAVIAGLTVARFIEAGLSGVLPAHDNDTSLAYYLALAGSWTAGAFTAAMTAILIGRRWAALGWLGASTMLFSAVMTILTAKLPWVLFPGAFLGAIAAAYIAVKITGANYQRPENKTAPGQGLFDD